MDELDWFNERFLHELDSWFTADIACCDACYETFVAAWPAAFLRDINFQKSEIPLSSFYSGSRLRDEYSEEQFWEYVKQLECPRCGNKFRQSFWPYNFPFSPPDGFEELASELAEIARTTPFLVLQHPLAGEILEAIEKAAADAMSEPLPTTYFRGRLAEQVPTPTLEAFDRPPPARCAEGRYNHAGLPVLYLASDKDTCFRELGSPETDVVIAELAIDLPLRILDLLVAADGVGDEVLSALVFSALVSAPTQSEGWDRPEYLVSRFVADCARSAGFQAIRYPSVRVGAGHNLVVLSDEPNDHAGMRLVSVHHVPPTVTEPQ